MCSDDLRSDGQSAHGKLAHLEVKDQTFNLAIRKKIKTRRTYIQTWQLQRERIYHNIFGCGKHSLSPISDM